MNNLLRNKLFYGILVLTFSCNQPAKQTAVVKNKPQQTENLQLSDPNQDQVLHQYLQLKNALVASNGIESRSSAKQLSTLLSDKEQLNAAKMADSIANAVELSVQRSIFTNLSNELIAILKTAKPVKGEFFVQFCPMANEGNGGYWLSAEEEINNPYYGDEMLNCGEVKEIIK